MSFKENFRSPVFVIAVHAHHGPGLNDRKAFLTFQWKLFQI